MFFQLINTRCFDFIKNTCILWVDCTTKIVYLSRIVASLMWDVMISKLLDESLLRWGFKRWYDNINWSLESPTRARSLSPLSAAGELDSGHPRPRLASSTLPRAPGWASGPPGPLGPLPLALAHIAAVLLCPPPRGWSPPVSRWPFCHSAATIRSPASPRVQRALTRVSSRPESTDPCAAGSKAPLLTSCHVSKPFYLIYLIFINS